MDVGVKKNEGYKNAISHRAGNYLNEIATNKWTALFGYLAGILVIVIGYLLPQDWSVWVMVAGLLLWTIPVYWWGYMYSRKNR